MTGSSKHEMPEISDAVVEEMRRDSSDNTTNKIHLHGILFERDLETTTTDD